MSLLSKINWNENIQKINNDSIFIVHNFDKENTGKILLEEFKYVMTTLGEKMNDEEYTKMLAEMKINPNDEEINYNEMVKFLAAD